MAKMTKAQARRRLMEAQSKIMKVNAAAYLDEIPLTNKDQSDLINAMRIISRMHNKLK
jgi:hypothetical protein